jgi:glycosyltransferase involved in cell wall biosynthesis
VDEVIIVDWNSTDDTEDVVRYIRPDAILVQQEGRGKGSAIKQGLALAKGQIIITCDGDGSMDPLDMLDALDMLLNQGFDFVKGSRCQPGGGSADFTKWRAFGNDLLTWCANKLAHMSWTDITYGFNAYHRRVMPMTVDLADGFAFEIQLAARLSQSSFKVGEFVSWESPRVGGESKLNAIRDGVRILRVLWDERHRGASTSKATAK